MVEFQREPRAGDPLAQAHYVSNFRVRIGQVKMKNTKVSRVSLQSIPHKA